MARKRVYELAKELGLENKELISRLEKIGIEVRSHSSTLDDSDLEKIQSEILSPDPQALVEQRIKSTVIRRRAVRLPTEKAAKLPKEEPPAAVSPQAAHMEAILKEAPRERAPKEVPVRTSIYRDRPAVETMPEPVVQAKAVPRPAKPVGPAAKVETVKPESPTAEPKAESTKNPAPEVSPKAQVAEKKPLPVRPPEHRKNEPPQIERERKPQILPEAAGPALPVPRKEFPIRPDPKIINGVEMLPLMDKGGRPEAEKPRKMGIKPPVEVLTGETLATRKKALIRKRERKRKRIGVERGEERSSKSHDKKKAAPPELTADPSLSVREGINSWSKLLFSAIAIALRKLKGSIQTYLLQRETAKKRR
jgi:translation initiation factor IF-2